MFGEKLKEKLIVKGKTACNKHNDSAKTDPNDSLVQDKTTEPTSSLDKEQTWGWFPRGCAHLLVKTGNKDGAEVWKLFQLQPNDNQKLTNKIKPNNAYVSESYLSESQSDDQLIKKKED